MASRGLTYGSGHYLLSCRGVISWCYRSSSDEEEKTKESRDDFLTRLKDHFGFITYIEGSGNKFVDEMRRVNIIE